MQGSVKIKSEFGRHGIGPFMIVSITLEHREVATADTANRLATTMTDFIVSQNPIPNRIKSKLTRIYGELRSQITWKDQGNGVIVETHVPTGAVGVPYSKITARHVATSSSAAGGSQRRTTSVLQR